MTKLTPQKIENIKNILAENHISKVKLSIKDLADLAETNSAVISYYKKIWGYSKRIRKVKKLSNLSPRVSTGMTLGQAIQICKSNGLKVTREKITVEEL